MSRKKKKRKELKEDLVEKRKASFKGFCRDNRHSCRLGTCYYIERRKFFVVVTTTFFVYLLNKLTIRKYTWEEFDEITKICPKLENKHINWTPEVRNMIRVIKHEYKFINGKIKEASKHITKKPKVKKTPIPKRKSKKRKQR